MTPQRGTFALLALCSLAGAAVVHASGSSGTGSTAQWVDGLATFTDGPEGNDQSLPKPTSLPNAACGFGEMSSALYPGFPLAGISFKASPLAKLAQRGCGACLEIRCTDDSCANSKGPLVVTVYDECRDCEAGQLNLNAAAFNTLAPLDVGRLPIQWRQVPCAPRGGIVVHVDEFRASGGGWLRIAFKNVAGDGAPVSVQLSKAGGSNWLAMRNSYGGAWEMSKLPDAPAYDLLLTDRAGRKALLKGAVRRGAAAGEVQTAENFKA